MADVLAAPTFQESESRTQFRPSQVRRLRREIMMAKQDAPKDDDKHSTPPKPGDKDGQVKGPPPSPREPKPGKHTR